MDRRIELHDIFRGILGTDNVYFQPPPTMKLRYPCIIYQLEAYDTRFADDLTYSMQKRYGATLIDRNPDSELAAKLAALPYCRLDRPYFADNLNHWKFIIYH